MCRFWAEHYSLEWRPNIDAAFSFLISIGIIAFGVWFVAATIAAGSPWALIGLLTVLVGSISLYQATRDFKIA
jgi:hypothetical protein